MLNAVLALAFCAPVLLANEAGPGPAKTQPGAQTRANASSAASRSESGPSSTTTSSQHITSDPAAVASGQEEAGGVVTAEEIQARIANVEASAEIAEPLRSQILDAYRQALEQLSAAQTWSAKIADYEKGQADASADLEAVQQELDTVSNAPAVSLHLAESTTLDDLSQKMTGAEGELRQKQAAMSKLDSQAESRAERSQAVPGLLANANQQLEQISGESAAAAEVGIPAQLALAQRCLQGARRTALELEIRAYQEELACYQARSGVLATKRSKARLEVSQAQAQVDALRAAAKELRKAEIRKQKEQAEAELKNAPEEIQKQLRRSADLAGEREKLGVDLAEAQQKLEKVRLDEERFSLRFGMLRKRVEQNSGSDLLGSLTRSVRLDLKNLREVERQSRELDKKYAQVQSRLGELRDFLVRLTDIDSAKRLLLARMREDDPQLDTGPLEPRLRELLETRRDLLEGLKTDYETYSGELLQLIDAQGRLLKNQRAAREFVDRYSLWIPSAGLMFKTMPTDTASLSRRTAALIGALSPELPQQIPVCCLAVTALLAWLALAPRLRAAIAGTCVRAAKVQTDSYGLTLGALLCTVVLAAFWPALLMVLGWRLQQLVDAKNVAAYEMARTLGDGLFLAALAMFFLSLLRQVCRSEGLAEGHFHWNTDALVLVRRNALWFMLVLAPGLFVIAAAEAYPDAEWRDLVGRTAYLLLMGALILFVWRVGHPDRGAFSEWLQYRTNSWLYQIRYVVFAIAAIVPLLLAVAAVVGYYYTAQQLALRLTHTVRLVFLVMLLHALLRRAVFVAQRRLALEQARRTRAAAAAARLAEQAGMAEETAPQIEDEKLDLISIGEQTRKLLRTVAWFILAIGLWLTWSELLPALSFVGDIKLWAYTATEAAQNADGTVVETAARVVKYVTLGNVVAAALVTIATFALARNIPGLLEIMVLQRLPLDTGGRFATTAVSRYVITVTGLVIAFGEIGVGWSKVQWLVAAMTVGLGFGLQEIFANFVSGLMLLFERPIRIGDTVTIGEISGVVSRIRIRATTITGWDRKELVIPNKEFITGKVVNWTLSDSTLRIVIPVGIAYGSDTDLAERLLHKVARAHPHVLSEPAPGVYFIGFGESALNFELRVFVASVDQSLITQHELNKAIDREFRAAAIEMAFPQRDIHVRTIEPPLRMLEVRNPGQESQRGMEARGEAGRAVAPQASPGRDQAQ